MCVQLELTSGYTSFVIAFYVHGAFCQLVNKQNMMMMMDCRWSWDRKWWRWWEGKCNIQHHIWSQVLQYKS